jgi:hypothetical protein
MKTHKTHPSYVMQSGNQQVPQSEAIHCPAPRVALCTGTTSQEVVKGSIGKHKKVSKSEKLIMFNYFNTPNMS